VWHSCCPSAGGAGPVQLLLVPLVPGGVALTPLQQQLLLLLLLSELSLYCRREAGAWQRHVRHVCAHTTGMSDAHA
jgi:hypothetical protein